MENSTVKQVLLNDRYLFVQSTSMGRKVEDKSIIEIDYTWIFTKGARTYMNAYHVIDHASGIVDIDFDREKSHLYIADQHGLTLRQID